MNPQLPNASQRITNIGRTGSGKTVFGCWLLSKMPVDQMPFVIFNFKSDALIDAIPFASNVDVGYVPKHSGVYITHPLPEEQEELEEYLWKLWARRQCGIFVDECFMMGTNNKAFETILTQGRSLRMPAIINTQRPAWVSRFVWSESDFFSVFDLNDERDWETIEQFIPVRDKPAPPQYHSYYFEVARKQLFEMKPVPNETAILDSFENLLRKRRKYI